MFSQFAVHRERLKNLLEDVARERDLGHLDPEGDLDYFFEVIAIRAESLHMSRRSLPTEVKGVDEKGRITIPRRFRVRLGITPGHTSMEIQLYPIDNPKGLTMRKAY